MFAVRFNFRFKDSDCYRTRTGGFFSILYMIFSAYYVYITFNELIQRRNFTLSKTNSVVDPAPKIFLKKSNFNFGVALFHHNLSSIDERVLNFFNYKISLITFDSTNKENTRFDELNLKRCEREEIARGINVSKVHFNLSAFICGEISDDINIEGYFGSSQIKYISFELEIKSHFLNTGSKEFEFIQDFLISNHISVTVFWDDYSIEVKNFSNPIRPWVGYFTHIIDFYSQHRVFMDFSLMQYSVDTDFLFPNPEEREFFTFRQSFPISVGMLNRTDPKIEDRGKLITFNIRSSPDIIIIDQVYQKIPDFLANLGGLQTNILLILSLFLNYFTNIWANQSFVNNSFRFKERLSVIYPQKLQQLIAKFGREHIKKEYEQTFDGSLRDAKTFNKERYSGNLTEIELEIRTDHSESIDVNLERVRRVKSMFIRGNRQYNEIKHHIFKEKKPIKFNLLEIIFRTCALRRCFLFRNKLKLFEKCNDRIDYFFDVFTYVRKFQEFEILKHILLNNDQIKMFAFLTKPSVSLTETKDIYKEMQSYVDFNPDISMETINMYAESYFRMKNYQDDINKKILTLVDHELDSILLA